MNTALAKARELEEAACGISDLMLGKSVAVESWDGVYQAKPDPAIGMADTHPLVAWTDAQVAFVMTFWRDHRHDEITAKLVREMLESAVKAR